MSTYHSGKIDMRTFVSVLFFTLLVGAHSQEISKKDFEKDQGFPWVKGTRTPEAKGDTLYYEKYTVVIDRSGDEPAEGIFIYQKGADLLQRPWLTVEMDVLIDCANCYFAGIIGDILLVDSGTGSVREMYVVNIFNARELVKFGYSEFVMVRDGNIYAYEPVDEAENPEPCENEEENLSAGFSKGFEQLVRYDIKSGELTRYPNYICVWRE